MKKLCPPKNYRPGLAQRSPGEPTHRRGATMVLSAGLMVTMLSFLALTIDLGFLAASRSQLRRTADAAAMAGCWEIYEQLAKGQTFDQAASIARQRSSEYAAANAINHDAPFVDPSAMAGKILVGYMDPSTGDAITKNSDSRYLAVRVLVERRESVNGEIPLYFGRIFGRTGQRMESSATAVMARRVSGFSAPNESDETLNLLPFALDLPTWLALLNGSLTDDAYTFTGNQVRSGKDGIAEVNLYPQGTGSPGNRGTVDIGGANNSTKDLARQIVHGINAADMAALGKPLVIKPGETLTLNGDTGISAGVKDELASIIGQTRIIPIFRSLSGNGNNAQYVIDRWAGVRILYVKLTGKMSDKKVIVQPAQVLSRQAISEKSGSHSSDYVLTPVHLAL